LIQSLRLIGKAGLFRYARVGSLFRGFIFGDLFGTRLLAPKMAGRID
jgi:hypothetical protein